jgi:hypothetical protein
LLDVAHGGFRCPVKSEPSVWFQLGKMNQTIIFLGLLALDSRAQATYLAVR